MSRNSNSMCYRSLCITAPAKTVRGPTNVRGLGGDSIGRPRWAVAYAALALGDDRWHAAMTPADKIARIAALQA